MSNEVIAELEIDGNKILHFTDIFLRQRFNEHHEFSIRINHDVLETFGSFSLDNSKTLIGKLAVIRFLETTFGSNQLAYEFRGIICEIGMVRSDSSAGDLLIKGYSPTILLEDGPRLASFSMDDDKNLTDIVSEIIKKANCNTFVNPTLKSNIKYVCQYKESSFNFVNRLSSDYGELFYYDGKTLIFGNPNEIDFVPVTYGEDMSDMQLNLHVQPIEVAKYAYNSLEGKLVGSAGEEINKPAGLNNYSYAQHVVQESNRLYSKIDALPLAQPGITTNNEVSYFVTKNKESIAAGLVVLTGTTSNPSLFPGSVADVKISVKDGGAFRQEDYGAYLVIGVTHHITAHGRYHNTFEALSGWVKGVPVYNIIKPKAEPQFGKVVDNKDPDKLSRVRVKLEWQLPDNEKTPWIWVMTPDAGSGKDGAAGGGFVFIPQVDDRVLVGFEHNNPDMPFVFGSVFHGKTGNSGDSRCITGRKTKASVCIVGDAIHIIDGKDNKIILDGTDKIIMEAKSDISLKVGDSYIHIEKSKISIKSETVVIQGTTEATIKKDDSTYFWVRGTQATVKGSTADIDAATAEVKGSVKATLGGGTVEVNANGPTQVKGTPLLLNP